MPGDILFHAVMPFIVCHDFPDNRKTVGKKSLDIVVYQIAIDLQATFFNICWRRTSRRVTHITSELSLNSLEVGFTGF